MTVISSVAAVETIELEPAGVRAGADSGNPQTSVRGITSSNGIDTGVWECTPVAGQLKTAPTPRSAPLFQDQA